MFLLSLLGTASMADAGSHTEVNTKKILKEGNVLEKKGAHTSEKKVDVPMTPLWQDIKNHPVLWGVSYILCVFSSGLLILANFFFFVFLNVDWESVHGKAATLFVERQGWKTSGLILKPHQ